MHTFADALSYVIRIHTPTHKRVHTLINDIIMTFIFIQATLDSGNASIAEDTNVHDVASLLKQYLRELPEPLITSRLFPVFEACYSLSQPTERQRCVLLACLLLPRIHLQVRHCIISTANVTSV